MSARHATTVFVGNPLAPHEDPSQLSKYCRECGRDALKVEDNGVLTCQVCGVEQSCAFGNETDTEYRTFGEDHAEDQAKMRVERDDRHERHAEATEGLNSQARSRFQPARKILEHLCADQLPYGQAALSRDEMSVVTARLRRVAQEFGGRKEAAREAVDEGPVCGGSPAAWAIYLARDVAARRARDTAAWTVPAEWMVDAWGEDRLQEQIAVIKSDLHSNLVILRSRPPGPEESILRRRCGWAPELNAHVVWLHVKRQARSCSVALDCAAPAVDASGVNLHSGMRKDSVGTRVVKPHMLT